MAKNTLETETIIYCFGVDDIDCRMRWRMTFRGHKGTISLKNKKT